MEITDQCGVLACAAERETFGGIFISDTELRGSFVHLF
jgi:hypothetical protein